MHFEELQEGPRAKAPLLLLLLLTIPCFHPKAQQKEDTPSSMLRAPLLFSPSLSCFFSLSLSLSLALSFCEALGLFCLVFFTMATEVLQCEAVNAQVHKARSQGELAAASEHATQKAKVVVCEKMACWLTWSMVPSVHTAVLPHNPDLWSHQ